jgi:phosphomannomutase
MPFVRSISGLRATVDDGALNDDLVRDYCLAYSQILPAGDIVIGMDGRPSGKHIIEVASEALSANGRSVIVAGIVPTPTVQLLVENSDAAGGIIVTASHNPAEWNGLKFLGGDGVFLDAEKNAELWNVADNRLFDRGNGNGEVITPDDALDFHLQSIMAIPVLENNLEKIKAMKLRAVVDAVNASGSRFIPALLERLGVEAIPLFCDESGIFPHTPEPLPQNLKQLAAAVQEHKADIGIAVDPDADRLVMIDGTGKPIGEEMTIALAVESVLSAESQSTGRKALVVNLSTTRLVEDIAAEYGADFYRSPVGEINVVRKMQASGAIIGGEGSGGVIYPACHYGRDSLVGTALVLSLMARRNQTLEEITGKFPKYEIVKHKQEFSGDILKLVAKIAGFYMDAKVNLDDGIRIDFPKSWVQLRGSNTEPIIRIIAEAPTKAEAERLVAELKNRI